MNCGCVETIGHQSDECEQRLRGLEELIDRDVSEIEAKESAAVRGQHTVLVKCTI